MAVGPLLGRAGIREFLSPCPILYCIKCEAGNITYLVILNRKYCTSEKLAIEGRYLLLRR
jgi:hypothetical protein